MFEEEYAKLRLLGRAGLDVYAGLERSQLRADLAAFLEHDSDFRMATGAVPLEFELRIPPTALGSVTLSGLVDRLDSTPDGKNAWVIDYKTGSTSEYERMVADDPFAGGTKLQLPFYVLAAGGAEQVRALYWFISRRGEFALISYDETAANRQRFQAVVQSILDARRAGSFPAVPGDENDYYGGFDNCRYCQFDRLCSRRRTYELQEKWQDPGMTPWRRIGEIARGEAPP
jgi:hypothetical protein